MLTDDPRLPPRPIPAVLAPDEAAALAAIVDVGGSVHTERVKDHIVILQDLRDRGLVGYSRGMTVFVTDDGRAALLAHRAATLAT